jgi:3'-phosphoadenosine 5'-phosphosulfate sulfotransferase (PAPS reductase)/FAD synthetase
MQKYISLSGGVESTTMCILYGADAKAICSDTVSEHKVMYDRLKLIEDRIKLIHPNFEIIKLIPSVLVKGEFVNTIEQAAILWKFMPSGQKRWCTGNFKIKPIDHFLSQQGECELMIGFNVDEEHRIGNLEKMENVNYRYPLCEDGYTRKDCEDILHTYGLHPNFPAYMSRGGCRMCFFKSEKEYKALWFLNINEYLEVQAFEEAIQDRRKKFYSIMGNGKSLRQLAKECEHEKSMFPNADWNEIYKMPETETSCGAFCHR